MLKQGFPKQSAQKWALLALLLLVPAQIIGALMSLVIAPGAIGQSVLLLTKLWMLALPVIWLIGVERQTIQIPKPDRPSLIAGSLLGIGMFAIILATYWWIGRGWMDVRVVRQAAQRVGVLVPVVYLGGSLFWIFINSLLEEYVWRWFVYRQCEIFMGSEPAHRSGHKPILYGSPIARSYRQQRMFQQWLVRIAPVFVSALLFTLHHIIDLATYFDDWRVVVVGSFAVFLAGTTWSACYLIYRSIWASYVSHIGADMAIALVGWHILFAA